LQLEGPLDNDAYLPLNIAAQAELARGDQSLLLARAAEGQAADATAHWISTCEAWRNALLRAEVGESVPPRPIEKPGQLSPWPDAERANERYTEGLEAAVFWRVAQLPQTGRKFWRQRFEPLAREALERAGNSDAALRRVERGLPATRGAAVAALWLAELALERGEIEAGRAWLARASGHVELGELQDPALLAALDRRRQLLGEVPVATEQVWQSATELEFQQRFDLELARNQNPRQRALGSGPQAGMAFLEGGRALIQTSRALWWLDAQKGRLLGPFEDNAWLSSADLRVTPSSFAGEGPGWRHDPAARGVFAVVVAGRSDGSQANVLACLDNSPGSDQPRPVWVLAADDPKLDPAARGTPDDLLEFQPTPAWIDTRVFVLRSRARASAGEREIELLALDAQTGALLWSTFLGKGGERSKDVGRFARRGLFAVPAEPLMATPAGIFAAAQLGFCALVEPLDGRVRFSLRNRRRDPQERGWAGFGPSLDDSAARIAWAPADSDHLYVLDPELSRLGRAPISGAPMPIGEAEALVGTEISGALLLSRSGARRALARWDMDSGARQDALRLGPEELFSGRALASPKRVFVASDRALYLFDREKELGLLAVAGLQGGVPRGGNVWAQGAWVFVLSNRTVEIFRVK
jgi:hypothetical protein